MAGDLSAEMKKVFRGILKDIQVDLKEEFDQNFEREGYFSEAWSRRKSPVHGGRSGHLLEDTGALRGSIRSEIRGDSVFFFSDLPYAGIHNEGGEIVVTARMKRFFWGKYREANGGSWGRRGETASRGTEAEFWKLMALKKVGTAIKIPRRQFLGGGPEVEKIVTKIVEDGLGDYFEHEFNIEIKSR